MKKVLVVIAAVLASSAVHAQGVFNFINVLGPSSNRSIDAPVFRPDGTTGAGAGFTAQFFTADGTALTPATVFRTDVAAAAAYVVDPGTTVTVPGVPSGGTATLFWRAWETAAGSYENAVIKGQSANVSFALGGGTLPPTNPVGLVGFTMVPEPSTITLGVLGAAALLLRRRK